MDAAVINLVGVGILGLGVLIGRAAFGAQVRLGWDASPSTNVTGYVLYAGTNSVTNTNAAPMVRVDVGTNLTASIDSLASGRWYFHAVAYTEQGVESLPSNELVIDVPEPVSGLRTIIIEHTITLTNGWTNVGFFRLRVP